MYYPLINRTSEKYPFQIITVKVPTVPPSTYQWGWGDAVRNDVTEFIQPRDSPRGEPYNTWCPHQTA